MTAVDWFVKDLRERGVEWIATLCGHGLDPLDYAARQAGMRLVDVRNEQTAGYMAEVYGRLRGRPGVAAVSSGVAHANGMTGVVDAFLDQAPMLLISGAHAHATAGMGHFQDLDQSALARPVTKYAGVIDRPERVLQVLAQAWIEAVSTPHGPVNLTFPMDIQEVPVEEAALVAPTPTPIGRSAFDPADVEAAAEALRGAERPLIIVGSGAYYGGEGRAIAEFSKARGIPLAIPIWDRGTIEEPLETFVGLLGAATGGPRLLADADLIILAGAVADYRVGFLQPGAVAEGTRVIRLDRGWTELALVDPVSAGRFEGWLAEARGRRDEFRVTVRQRGIEQAGSGLHAVHVVDAVGEVLTDETLFLMDGGSIGQWAHQLLTDRYPSTWLSCGRSGVVGWGLGGAMAARLTYPDRPVLLLAGDGSFTFTPAEIECAVRQKIPFVVLVADDQAWGITQSGHQDKYGEAITSSLGPIDFVKLAEAFGARGVKAETPEQLAAALRKALDEREVTVIHAPIVGGSPAG